MPRSGRASLTRSTCYRQTLARAIESWTAYSKELDRSQTLRSVRRSRVAKLVSVGSTKTDLKIRKTKVRFGSEADITSAHRDARLVPGAVTKRPIEFVCFVPTGEAPHFSHRNWLPSSYLAPCSDSSDEIPFAQFNTAVPQDVVGRGAVEIKVGQHEIQQIGLAFKTQRVLTKS